MYDDQLFIYHNTELIVSHQITAAKKRTSTYFIKCHELIQNLKRAKLENRLETRLKHYAKLYYQVIVLRYEIQSTLLTTNVNFKAWDEVFQDAKLANTIVDCVLHHTTLVSSVGHSYRIKNYLEKEE